MFTQMFTRNFSMANQTNRLFTASHSRQWSIVAS